jgi:PII-like signaling protein
MVAPLSTLPEIQARPNMTINDDGILLRVFIGESDRAGHKPLYEAIVQKARELGLAGATVLRGAEGFGAHSVVHKARLLEMSADLPIVVEIVDSAEKIQALLPHLDAMVTEGMITMENVRVLVYRA